MSNGKLIDRVFLLFLTYIAFAVAFVSASASEFTNPTTFLSVYFLTGTSIAWVFSAFTLFANKIKHPPLRRPKTLLGLTTVLAVVYCVSRYILLRYNIVWQDELTQFLGSASKNNAGFGITHLAQFAIDQQQPPLDYYLANMGYLLFGFDLLSLKVHAIFCGGMATLLLFWMLDEWTEKRWLSWGMVLMFGAMPFFMKYSLEARPLSLAVLTSLFTLYYTLRFWQGEQNLWNGVLLISSGMVMVTAIGLQPEVFMIVLFVSLVLASTLKRFIFKNPVRNWETLIIYQLIAVYFVPYFYAIHAQGKKYSQFRPLTSDWILENLRNVSVIPGAYFFQKWPTLNAMWGYSLMVLIVLALPFLHKEKRNSVKIPFVVLMLFICIFPAVFNFIFSTFIDWPNLPHYRIVYAAPFVILSTLAITVLINVCTRVHTWIGQTFYVSLVIFSVAFSAYDYSLSANFLSSQDAWKVDLASVYGYLSQRMGPDDHYVTLPFARMGDLPHPAFIGGIFFLKPHQLKKRISQPVGEMSLRAGRSLAVIPGKIWLLVNESTGLPHISGPFIERFKEIGSVKRFQNATVLELAEEKRPQLIQLMHETINKFPQDGDVLTFYEMLYSYYSFLGDTGNARIMREGISKLTVNRTVNSTGHPVDPNEIIKRRLASTSAFVKRYRDNKEELL